MPDQRNSQVTLYVPCDCITVEVRVGFGDGLSAMEQIALRVIDALARDRRERSAHGHDGGITSAERLAQILGLGLRVTLDLLHDLWRKQYVVLDFESGEVLTTAKVADAIRQGTLESLPGAELGEDSVELMVDRLTGAVWPQGGSLRPLLPGYAVEVEQDDGLITRVPGSELVASLERVLQRRNRERHGGGAARDASLVQPSGPPDLHPNAVDRRPRVQSYRLGKGGVAPIGDQRWIPLDVTVEEDADNGGVAVTVIDRDYPSARRAAAGARLTQLVAEQPASKVAGTLRGTARRALVNPPALDTLLADLTHAVHKLPTVPAGRRLQRHLELCDDARLCAAMTDNRIRAEVSAELVTGDRQLDRVTEVIASAERQLVLCTPSLGHLEWSRVEEAVEHLLDKGVQVLVLWGANQQDSLPKHVHTAMMRLVRREGAGLFLLPETSASVRVGAVVADDRAALLTSRPVLMPSRAGHAPAVMIRSTDGHGSAAVRDLLSWVGRTVPDGWTSRLVLISEDEFATKGQVPVLPDPPGLPLAPDEQGASGQTVRAWYEAWQGYAAALALRLRSRSRPSAELVEDAAHSDLLWQAARGARHRLLVATERLDEKIVDERFLTHLTERLNEGVHVTVSSPSLAPDRGGPAEELHRLARAHPGRLVLSRTAGRVLVRDDEVVVGSFDFLQRGRREASRPRHRRQAELGLRMKDPRLADEVCDHFRTAAAAGPAPADRPAPLSRRPPIAAPHSDPLRTSGGDIDVLLARQRLVEQFRPGLEGSRRMRAELARAADPWALLESIYAATDDALREAAVAQCLVDHADRADPQTLPIWRHRLVELRWQAGDFFAAAALRRLDPSPGSRPTPHLAAIAAAFGGPLTGAALTEVLVEAELQPGERAAVHAIAVAELLRSGDADSAAVVVELAGAATAGWQAFGEALLTAWRDSHQRALEPVVRRATDNDRHAHGLEEAWNALDDALRLAGQQAKYVGKAVRAHGLLFGPNGEFGRIVAAARLRDPAALRALTEPRFPVGKPCAAEVERLVDEVWGQVRGSHQDAQLYGKPRPKYLGRLEQAVQACHALYAAQDERDRTRSGLGDEERELTATLRAAYRQARHEPPAAGPAGRVEERVIRAVREYLDDDFGFAPAPAPDAGSGPGTDLLDGQAAQDSWQGERE